MKPVKRIGIYCYGDFDKELDRKIKEFFMDVGFKCKRSGYLYSEKTRDLVFEKTIL